MVIDYISGQDHQESGVRTTIEKLIKKRFVEKFSYCPYCKKEYALNIPPVCDNCNKRILPESLIFKSKQYWPRFLIRLNKEKKELVKDFDHHSRKTLSMNFIIHIYIIDFNIWQVISLLKVLIFNDFFYTLLLLIYCVMSLRDRYVELSMYS